MVFRESYVFSNEYLVKYSQNACIHVTIFLLVKAIIT